MRDGVHQQDRGRGRHRKVVGRAARRHAHVLPADAVAGGLDSDLVCADRQRQRVGPIGPGRVADRRGVDHIDPRAVHRGGAIKHLPGQRSGRHRRQREIGHRQRTGDHRLAGEDSAVVPPGLDGDVVRAGRDRDRVLAAGASLRGERIAGTGPDARDGRPLDSTAGAGVAHGALQVTGGANPAHRLVGVNPPVAIVIVRPRGAQIQRRVLHESFQFVRVQVVVAILQVGRDHQRDQARDVGRGHGGARPVRARVAAARHGGVDVHAGCGEFRLLLPLVKRGPPPAEGCNLVVYVRRADGDGLRDAARSADGTGTGRWVAGSEHRGNPARPQRLDGRTERIVRRVGAAPRVVDDVRSLGAVGRREGTAQVRRAQHPLEGLLAHDVVGNGSRDVQLVQRDSDPPGTRGHAHLGAGRATVADHRPHRVRAVIPKVKGGSRAAGTQVTAGVKSGIGIEPVIVVVGTGGAIPPVLGLQSGMGPVHTGIYAGHHRPLARDAKLVPHPLGIHQVNVPVVGVQSPQIAGRESGRIPTVPEGHERVVGHDALHVLPPGQFDDRVQVPFDGKAVKDVERLIGSHTPLAHPRVQERPDRSLGGLGRADQGIKDCRPLLRSGCKALLGNRLQIRLGLEVDEETSLVQGLALGGGDVCSL